MIRVLAEQMPCRHIAVVGDGSPPALLYTDCSATDGLALRIGLLLFPRVPWRPRCAVVDVPAWVVAYWSLRTTYIGQGELLAGPLGVYLFAALLQQRDLIWFLDSMSALGGLIRGGSAVCDNSAMAHRVVLTLASIRCRAWFDYVNTKDNPADVLSRAGYDDPLVRRRVSRKEWLPVSVDIPWHSLLTLSPEDLWQMCSALGSS